MDPWQYVWSTNDLIHWEKHPGLDARKAVSFEEVQGLPASDCIERNGKYYYYFTAGGCQCVAFSDKPGGPFLNARKIAGTEWLSCGDPSVFVDDDNIPYLFWGQFKLHGCRLKDNMAELDENFHVRELLTEERDGFHEGSSIRKRGCWYYMIYADISRGSATCLSYAKSKSPLGPYKVDEKDMEYLTRWLPGEGAIYRYLDFGKGKARRFVCSAASYLAVTDLELHLDGPDGPIIGVCRIDDTGGYGYTNFREFSCPVKSVSGVHELVLVGRAVNQGHRQCDLWSFRFE